MPYEIDFLAVGDGSQGGDAIAMRFGEDLTRRDGHQVVIIDGGRPSTGYALVHHVLTVYRTTEVDLVLNTHPDIDHVGGLKTVLDVLDVKVLAMHRPWLHAGRVRWTFANGRLTTRGLADKLRASVEAAHDLEQAALVQAARGRNIRVVEPIAAGVLTFGSATLRVLGPSLDFYERLLCQFEGTPEARIPEISRPRLRAPRRSHLESLHPASESIRDGETTSAENSSSVITMLECDGSRVLLTGDAGVVALSHALAYAHALGTDPRLAPFALMQVPHHGSRHNVGPSLLNYARALNAVISAPPTSDDHPCPNVANALVRRGTTVYSTSTGTFRFYSGMAPRLGWRAAVGLPFSPLVAA